jgi:hypothetical protein
MYNYHVCASPCNLNPPTPKAPLFVRQLNFKLYNKEIRNEGSMIIVKGYI